MALSPLDTALRWFHDADRVLIGAGAGLSAAAGYDYTDTTRFAELFPAHHRLGFRARYEFIGHRLPAPLHWGYWAVHVNDIRFDPAPNLLYQQLRALVGEREHFVITSNVDALFERNGFDHDRVYTPQGDYGLYQCTRPCSRAVRPSRALIERALDAYNPGTGEVTDATALPSCPDCGDEVFLNVRIGPEFIDDHLVPNGERLVQWLSSTEPGERVVVLELGAGFNTPSVIRWPMERITHVSPLARLVRINLTHPETPLELGERAIGLALGASEFLHRTATRSAR